MRKLSAILQMFYGKRGKGDKMNLSEDYREAVSVFAEKQRNFIDRLKTYPELSKLYAELNDENAEFAEIEVAGRVCGRVSLRRARCVGRGRHKLKGNRKYLDLYEFL